ncbi:AAA family ATPase [Anaerovibrio sp.]|uniref:AAA family ATPase n=1 Tax=Anaerovibrio sp. TaxID=1872532 RepID=UPI003F143164
MKPIKLIISGIGPYGDRMPEINFQEFELNRPILIAGETGAGKTMIFDAICFALFDAVSGSYRGTDSLRSEYAGPGTESYVDFYFSHQGREYRIYRQPSYMRPLKRGSGFRQEKEKAVLYPGDDAPIEGIKAVNQAVRELLHVDEKQFKQLAMIAQGEFWGLLNARTEERTGILRHIFMTEGYKSMELQLREKRNRAAKAVDVLERSMIQYFCEAEAEPESPLAGELEQLQARLAGSGGICGVEEMLSLLDRAAAEDEPALRSLQEQMEKLQQSGQELQKDFALAENHEHNIKKHVGLQKQLAELQERLKGYERQEQELTEAEKSLQEKLGQLQGEQEKLKEAPEQLAVCQQEISSLGELLERLDNLQKQQIPRYGRVKKKLGGLQAGLVEAQVAHAAASGARQEGEMCLERNRAGILALGLQEGRPCPVCGSVSHPSPAGLPEKAVTEAEVKTLQQKEKKAAEAREAAASAAAAASAELAVLDEQIGGYMLECLQSGIWLEAVARGEAFAMEVPDKAGLRQLYELIQLQQGRLAGILAGKQKKADGLQEMVRMLRRVERELAAAGGREMDELRRKRQLLQKERESIGTAIADREGQLQLLGQLTGSGGRSEAELAEYRQGLQIRLQENKARQEKCQQEQGRISRRRENNLSRREKIAGQQADFDKAKHEAAILGRLYNLVSGQTGNGKLTLEQYVQAAGFDSIIRAANRRLGPMSDGQYELYRQEKELGNKSHTYLDLEVLDNYTGKRRPVRSLSGGESFKASLSLALGLSDKVSSELGGICMDALFIDEGFGTLDRKSIERAMEILLKLSDSSKLVAIISHREELIEAVPQQIQVTKTRTGSSLRIETGK